MSIYTKQDDFNQTLSRIQKIAQRIKQSNESNTIKKRERLLNQVAKTPSKIYFKRDQGTNQNTRHWFVVQIDN